MKTVVITGAGGKIGQACAEKAAEIGYNVAVCYRTSKSEAANVCNKINSAENEKTGMANSFYVDVRDEKSVANMFCEVNACFGSIDALVNNAGIACYKLLNETTQQEWDNVFNSNVKSAYLCSKYALDYMLIKKQGNIINISSMWGQVGASCEVAYSAAKAALIGFTKALAKELGPSNINVNCIAPGVIETNMLDDFTQQEKSSLEQQTPLGRLGMPKDIANTMQFLLSGKASFITGQIIGVNGGFVI